MVILKLTDKQAGALGLDTNADALALLELSAEIQATNEKLVAELAAEQGKTNMDAETLSRIDALEERIKTIESIPAVDADAIIKRAIAGATDNVMKVVAKVGANSLPSEGSPGEVTTEKTEIAEDDYEGQWLANVGACHDEFSSYETFLAFSKANAAGQVKINTIKQTEQ